MARLFTAVASAARTTTGSQTFGTQDSSGKALRIQLDVTAASGTTPTLDVVIEDTLDGTNWNTVGTAFTQKTAAGREVKDITGLFHGQMRVRWTIGGTTPSFTFSVKGVFVGE